MWLVNNVKHGILEELRTSKKCMDNVNESRLVTSFPISPLQVKNGLVDAVRKVKVGNPFDEDTFMGPMISESAAKGVEDWIHDAVDKGGRVLIGGTRDGSFVQPTIMERVPLEADARKEEIFGPVLLIYPYS